MLINFIVLSDPHSFNDSILRQQTLLKHDVFTRVLGLIAALHYKVEASVALMMQNTY